MFSHVDPPNDGAYHSGMDKNQEHNLIEQELRRLESRIEQLVDSCKRLEQENRLLRSQQETWSLERANLITRQDQARTRVEAMIDRLRSMEEAL